MCWSSIKSRTGMSANFAGSFLRRATLILTWMARICDNKKGEMSSEASNKSMKWKNKKKKRDLDEQMWFELRGWQKKIVWIHSHKTCTSKAQTLKHEWMIKSSYSNNFIFMCRECSLSQSKQTETHIHCFEILHLSNNDKSFQDLNDRFSKIYVNIIYLHLGTQLSELEESISLH